MVVSEKEVVLVGQEEVRMAHGTLHPSLGGDDKQMARLRRATVVGDLVVGLHSIWMERM